MAKLQENLAISRLVDKLAGRDERAAVLADLVLPGGAEARAN
jgi:hypothetical protein